MHLRGTLRPADSIALADVWRSAAWNWEAAAGRARAGSGAEVQGTSGGVAREPRAIG